MDHTYIEEQHIADRYVTGSLDPAEAEVFEDHYLSCPECLDRLELAETVKRGFVRLVEQEQAERSTVRQLALVVWLARLGRRRQLALLAVALLVLLLPTGFALRGFAARDRALAEARAAHSAQLGLQSDLQASQRDLAALRASVSAPQGSPPIVYLDPVRGATGEPPQRLPQPGPGGSVVLAWVLDAPYSPTYLAILQGSDGKELWRGPLLGPPERETMTLFFPGALLPPGDYSLLVQGQSRDGRLTSARRFSFRILPPA